MPVQIALWGIVLTVSAIVSCFSHKVMGRKFLILITIALLMLQIAADGADDPGATFQDCKLSHGVSLVTACPMYGHILHEYKKC